MKAIITTAYGGPEVLEIQDIDQPTIGPNEVLVKVKAFSVNPVDWKVRSGALKFMTGKTPPKVLGGDYAGVVVEVGENMTQYKAGDEVYGMVNAFEGRAYAEYIAVSAEEVCLKPANLSFTEAASLPLTALTAYQGLVDDAKAQSEETVFVNGCTGGVGLNVVQIAKELGCTVSGSCSTKNLETAKNLGLATIVDYKNDDVTKLDLKYDVFFDAAARNKGFRSIRPILNKGGRYIETLPSLSSFTIDPIVSALGSKKSSKIMVKPSHSGLDAIRGWAETGKIVPLVEQVFAMDQIQAAHHKSEAGGFSGKLVVEID